MSGILSDTLSDTVSDCLVHCLITVVQVCGQPIAVYVVAGTVLLS